MTLPRTMKFFGQQNLGMHEEHWLSTRHAADIFRTIPDDGSKTLDRKYRLFSAACLGRQIKIRGPGGKNVRAYIKSGEAMADGVEVFFHTSSHGTNPRFVTWLSACVQPVARDGAAYWVGSSHITHITSEAANLLRDIFGNPFKCSLIRFDGRLCRLTDNLSNFIDIGPETIAAYSAPVDYWLTESVLTLATAIYEDRRYDDLPYLADALEEAGCDDATVIGHLRGTVVEHNDGGKSYWRTDVSGPHLTPERASKAHQHVRGCWVLDLLLGK